MSERDAFCDDNPICARASAVMGSAFSAGTIFEWYDFLKYDLRPDKVNFNYIRPPSADPKELEIDHSRYAQLAEMIDDDSRHAAIKNNYTGKAGFFKAAIDIYMHGLIAKTKETQTAQMTCYAGTAGGVIYDRLHTREIERYGAGEPVQRGRRNRERRLA